MPQPQDVLAAAQRPPPLNGAMAPRQTRLLLAGAGGALGAQVLQRLVASGLFAHTDVLTREPMTMALPRVGHLLAAAASPLTAWPVSARPYDVAVVMFEPPRSFNDRERAFFTPTPEQLPALAAWLQCCGVRTLVVVLPHAPGRLPDSLKRGLASLDEQTVASLGFERVLLVRSAAAPVATAQGPQTRLLEKLAQWMLSIASYMIPATEQPVRPERVAEFVEAALRVLPAGTFVASADLLHRASVGRVALRANPKGAITMTQVVHDWLNDQMIVTGRADATVA